jgi:anhydro-N-acetylmuramic acid kinase
MSGTSADGIDAVVARIAGSGRGLKAKLIAHAHRGFSSSLRNQILRVCLHGTVAEICELNFALGEQFAEAAPAVMQKAELSPRDIAVIGSHGQTIHHLPNAKHASTLQIGEAAIIAERTGVATVSDFRVGDMAAGGQGAPLVPYADWVLFTDAKIPRIVQNIGGIGNLTFLPPRAKLEEVIAFDTGPGNMLIDAVMAKLTHGKHTFDRNGDQAAKGRVSNALIKEWMRHPYIRRLPPKTTGREEFGEMFVNQALASARRLRLKDEDLIATVTAFTAVTIADAYRRFVFPKLTSRERSKVQIILGGGGAKNGTLKKMLQAELGCGELFTHDDFGIPNSAKEALAFAILAHETLSGSPGNVPSATGATRAVVLGKIAVASQLAPARRKS